MSGGALSHYTGHTLHSADQPGVPVVGVGLPVVAASVPARAPRRPRPPGLPRLPPRLPRTHMRRLEYRAALGWAKPRMRGASDT